MFGNLLKNVTGNLNLEGIAKLLIQQIPQGESILSQALQMAKSGQNPGQVMQALEGMIPGAKEKLKDNQIWGALRNKSPEEIEEYARNMVKTLNLTK